MVTRMKKEKARLKNFLAGPATPTRVGGRSELRHVGWHEAAKPLQADGDCEGADAISS